MKDPHASGKNNGRLRRACSARSARAHRLAARTRRRPRHRRSRRAVAASPSATPAKRDPAARTDRRRHHRLHGARRVQGQRHLRRGHRRHGPQDPGRRRGRCGIPCWSPDGKKIAYDESVRRGPGVVADLGHERGRLRQDAADQGLADLQEHSPSWSPDGKRIVFTSLVFDTDGVERDAIYVMNADGSGVRNVTSEMGPGVLRRLLADVGEGRHHHLLPEHPRRRPLQVQREPRRERSQAAGQGGRHVRRTGG